MKHKDWSLDHQQQDCLTSSHPSCRWCPDSGSGSAGRRGKRRWSVTSSVASAQRRKRFWTLFWSRAWTSSSLSCPSKTPNRSPSPPPHQQGADTQHRIGRRGSAQLLQLRTLLLHRAEVSKLRRRKHECLQRGELYLFSGVSSMSERRRTSFQSMITAQNDQQQKTTKTGHKFKIDGCHNLQKQSYN